MTSAYASFIQKGACVIDVRSPTEYAAGHFEGSLNISLASLHEQHQTLPAHQTLIVCCASGGRSAQAKIFLDSKGYTVVDAGAWKNLLP